MHLVFSRSMGADKSFHKLFHCSPTLSLMEENSFFAELLPEQAQTTHWSQNQSWGLGCTQNWLKNKDSATAPSSEGALNTEGRWSFVWWVWPVMFGGKHFIFSFSLGPWQLQITPSQGIFGGMVSGAHPAR